MTTSAFPASIARRWPDKESGPWVLRVTFDLVGDRPGVVGVELYAVDPKLLRKVHGDLGPMLVTTEAITSTGIRVPLQELLTEFLAGAKRSAEIHARSQSAPPWRSLEQWREDGSQRLSELRRVYPDRKRPGRPAQYGPEHFGLVAELYNDALRAGSSPTRSVADTMNVNKSTAAKWVARARDLGFLPPTVRGKAAGQPARKQGRNR